MTWLLMLVLLRMPCSGSVTAGVAGLFPSGAANRACSCLVILQACAKHACGADKR